VNTIVGGLRNPRSVAWNVELDRQVTSGLTVRAGFQQRNTTRDFFLTPGTVSDPDILSLSSGGRSFYREFQVSGRYKIAFAFPSPRKRSAMPPGMARVLPLYWPAI
jgi:hypothetical protein